MTRLVFETATLQDAIKKAERVAPTKGSSFDKAAGIVLNITITPMEDPEIVVKATNTDVFFSEWLDCVEATGASTVWRFPSKLFGGLIASLPIGSGKEITLEEKPGEEGRIVHLYSGKTRCKFFLINSEYYPEWYAFADADLTTVSDLGGKLAMAAWAAADSDEDINGVHMDGERLLATDRYRLVTVPFKISIDRPITIPAAILAPLLKQTGDVQVGTDGAMFLVQPDEAIQIKTIINGGKYPNVDRIMRRDWPQKVEFPKEALLTIMRRSLNFTGADRFPLMRLFFGKEEINIFMEDAERGLLGDTLDVAGQIDHKRCEIKFTPKNIMEALERAPSDKVTLCYDPDVTDKTVYITDGSGYECWVMTRRGTGEK